MLLLQMLSEALQKEHYLSALEKSLGLITSGALVFMNHSYFHRHILPCFKSTFEV